MFVLSRFVGPARQWAILPFTTGNLGLGSVTKFVCLMRVIYGKGDFCFNLENYGGRPVLPFTTYYTAHLQTEANRAASIAQFLTKANKVASIPAELQPEANSVAPTAQLQPEA